VLEGFTGAVVVGLMTGGRSTGRLVMTRPIPLRCVHRPQSLSVRTPFRAQSRASDRDSELRVAGPDSTGNRAGVRQGIPSRMRSRCQPLESRWGRVESAGSSYHGRLVAGIVAV
jgi:hypothetical protein